MRSFSGLNATLQKMQSGETLIQTVNSSKIANHASGRLLWFPEHWGGACVLLTIVTVTIGFIWYFDSDGRLTAGLNLAWGIELYLDLIIFQNVSKSTHSGKMLFLWMLLFVLQQDWRESKARHQPCSVIYEQENMFLYLKTYSHSHFSLVAQVPRSISKA